MGSLTLRTLDAAPGKVRQLLIADVFKDGFLAKWKPPSLDFRCAQQYTTTLKGPQKKSFSVEKLYNKVHQKADEFCPSTSDIFFHRMVG